LLQSEQVPWLQTSQLVDFNKNAPAIAVALASSVDTILPQIERIVAVHGRLVRVKAAG
jgi:hypothetical protein